MTVQWGILSTARINDKFLGGVKPLLGRDDALGQVRTISALYQAAASAGTKVGIDG